MKIIHINIMLLQKINLGISVQADMLSAAKIGIFFPKITFNKRSYRDSRVLRFHDTPFSGQMAYTYYLCYFSA